MTFTCRLFCPLLGAEHKEYINNFAAESFSFLMRKVKDHGGMFDFMLAWSPGDTRCEM